MRGLQYSGDGGHDGDDLIFKFITQFWARALAVYALSQLRASAFLCLGQSVRYRSVQRTVDLPCHNTTGKRTAYARYPDAMFGQRTAYARCSEAQITDTAIRALYSFDHVLCVGSGTASMPKG